ncbi:MAG: hypothetical protein R3C68_18450 [Myxococcota bacterium]
MALDEKVKQTWQDIQSRHDVPVNAIGVPIRKNDANAFKVWKDEGIDAFLKK